MQAVLECSLVLYKKRRPNSHPQPNRDASIHPALTQHSQSQEPQLASKPQHPDLSCCASPVPVVAFPEAIPRNHKRFWQGEQGMAIWVVVHMRWRLQRVRRGRTVHLSNCTEGTHLSPAIKFVCGGFGQGMPDKDTKLFKW